MTTTGYKPLHDTVIYVKNKRSGGQSLPDRQKETADSSLQTAAEKILSCCRLPSSPLPVR
jgi:hypothetical protein